MHHFRFVKITFYVYHRRLKTIKKTINKHNILTLKTICNTFNMIYDYDDYNATAEDQPANQVEIHPDADTEFVTAKMFLQKCSTLTGDNL